MVVGRGGRGRGGGRGGGSRGGGRRGGSRGGRGGSSRGRGERGRGYRPRPVPTTENGDGSKSKPTFVKIKDIRPGNRSYDLIVKVTDSNLESTRTERRGGRQFTLKCSEALVGDETGCIKLSTRFPEKAQGIKDGITVVLLNVKVRRAQENAWIEVDNWGVIKEVEAAKDIIPEGTKLDFEINKANDKSRKEAAKPKFVKVESLEPDTKGHNLIVKVKSVKVENRTRLDGTSSQTAEAVVGDDTSLIILIARGDQIPSLKEGKVVAIYNSRIVMSKETFMRLVVDRWSAVKPIEQVDAKLLPENHITEATVLAEKNRSDIEWVKED